MKRRAILSFIITLGMITALSAQQNVGIGTDVPQRQLELNGLQDQYLRLRTTSGLGGRSGLELMRGNVNGTMDWRIVNDIGVLKLDFSINNFSTSEEAFRMTNLGHWGIGTTVPAAMVHVDNGEEATLTGDGLLMLGEKGSINTIFDVNSVMTRNNSNPATLFLQHDGGNTDIGFAGGNVQLGGGNNGGNVGIGTISPAARVSVNDTEFQLQLRNWVGDDNVWFIGASGASWVAGPDQLLFNPGTGSSDATLRLMNTPDNNGVTAPVMIRSAGSQTLLLDGNEIDAKEGALYINYNSLQRTYLNRSGGDVGIGTTATQGSLTIKEAPGETAFIMEKSNVEWGLNPIASSNALGFNRDGAAKAWIIGASGQWVASSDRRLKEDIQPLYDVLAKINDLELYSYTLKSAPEQKLNYGVLAQELEKVFPELVHQADDQYTVSYAQLSVIALKALQEQHRQIAALKNEIGTLMADLDR